MGKPVQAAHGLRGGLFRCEGRCRGIHNLSAGVIHGDAAALVVLVLVGHIHHVLKRQQVDVVLLADAQFPLDDFLHVLGIIYPVDEACLLVVAGGCKGHDTVVGHLVQLFRRHLAAFRHVAEIVLPDALNECLALFAVVLAHVLPGDTLHETLVFSYAHGLEFHARFL